MIIKKGTALSNGIAIGKAYVFFRDKVNVKSYKVQNVTAEIAKLNRAVSHTSKMLDQLQLLSKTYKELYEVYKMLLTDNSFIGRTVALIESESVNAEYALKKVTDEFMYKMSLSDNDYLKARMHDIQDIYMRIIRYMSNLSVENFNEASEDNIIIFNDFSVTDIDTMVNKKIKGFVSVTGNKMAHKSIIARESGLSAVSGIKNIESNIKNGDLVIVDGFLGYLIINPDESTLEKYQKKKSDYENFIQSLKNSHDTGCYTTDNEEITLYANINSNDELTHINVHGLHGVGLYRTEYIYINNGFMKEDEQYELLRNALISLKGRPLTVRTFDLGGDKISKFMPYVVEENPALGLRAVRYSMKYPEFFSAQIRAVLRAGVEGDIRLLIPMVSSIDELLVVKSIIENEKLRLSELNIPYRENLPVGIMIEVPSAAISINKFIKYADFFSVGTNDLIQYTLGVDRNNEEVNYLYSPVNPSVLMLLKNIHDEIAKSGKDVSICGELAGDSRYISVLIGLGYRVFSMNPRASYMIRKMITSLSVKECESFVNVILSCDTSDEIESLISAFNNKQLFVD